MILVVGATGMLGQKVVRRLLEDGQQVRAMTRDPARAAGLGRQGAQVVAGDLVDPTTLDAALAGVDRVLAAAHGFLGRGRYASERVDDAGHRALVDAARRAGVRRFVYVSALAASATHPVDFFRTKHAVEQCVRASGLEYVILRPSAFMEWHAHEFNGKMLLRKGKAMLLGTGATPRNFVATADVASLAVQALLSPQLDRQTIEIGGPGNFSDTQVAQMYAQAAGMQARIGRVPTALLPVLAALARPLHPGVSRVMQMAALGKRVDQTFDCTALLQQFPTLRLTPLQQFIDEQVASARQHGQLAGP